MTFYSTKYYPHSLGLSACFRQRNAKSHCRFLHGYSLAFTLKFGCAVLDANGWVMDFGALKPIKEFLVETFDHKLLVAYDDPIKRYLTELQFLDAVDVMDVPATGCEAFARLVFDRVDNWMVQNDHYPRAWIDSVECHEHEANSAIYERTK